MTLLQLKQCAGSQIGCSNRTQVKVDGVFYLPVSEFDENPLQEDGYAVRCRQCEKTYQEMTRLDEMAAVAVDFLEAHFESQSEWATVEELLWELHKRGYLTVENHAFKPHPRKYAFKKDGQKWT